MSAEQEESLDPRVQDVLDELRSRIRDYHPAAMFEVSRSPDEPENIHLTTTVDLEDPDEILDLVLDRLLQLQIEERIPVYVIPIRTPERILASMRSHDRPERRHLSTVVSDAQLGRVSSS